MQDKKSKSAKKREHLALQELGEKLIGLPENQLRSMSLDDGLLDAIMLAATIKSHSAMRRQRQLIGKLMKQVDPDPIRAALDALSTDSRQSKQRFKQAEEWRDEIVAGGRPLLQNFFLQTGRENPALGSLLEDLNRANSEGQRRTLRRSIFRQIHQDLGATQDQTGK